MMNYQKIKNQFSITHQISFILISLFSLINPITSIAQSLSVVSFDSLVVGDANTSNIIYSHAAIKNNSAYPIELMVKRIDGNYNELTDENAICWGICYPPDVSVSEMPITIEAGGVDSLNFTGHVVPDKDGIPLTGDITYVFFDDNNSSDSIAITVQYQVLLVTAIEQNPTDIEIHVYPNPSAGKINIDISQNVLALINFKLYDNTGSLVNNVNLINTTHPAQFNFEHLPKGIYLYTISGKEGQIKTGKLFLN